MDVLPTYRTAPTRDVYLAYMNSPAWRVTRNNKLREVNWRCERCQAKRDIQVHHTSYANFTHESNEDLEVLCANCHRDEHLARPDQTSLGLYLKLASEAVKADPWATIADLSETVKLRCVALDIPLLPERIKSALAVVCGRLHPPSIPRERRQLDDLRSINENGPLTAEEARDVFCRLDLAGSGVFRALIRTMPTPENMPDDPRTHEAKVRRQAVEFLKNAPAKRPSTMSRLQAIFHDEEGPCWLDQTLSGTPAAVRRVINPGWRNGRNSAAHKRGHFSTVKS